MQYPRIRDLREDNDRTQGETSARAWAQGRRADKSELNDSVPEILKSCRRYTKLS